MVLNEHTSRTLVCVLLCQLIHASDIFKENREILTEGEKKLNELQSFTLSPYGQCWTSVLSKLKTTCPLLNEDSHVKLAFGFTNCFMQQLGFGRLSCDDDDDVYSCLENVKSDNRWFSAYLQYHTHTHNMCYFLNHQLWLQKTESTIKKLAVSTHEVGKWLEETSEKQLELMRLQSDMVNTQKSLVDQGELLSSYLQNTKSSMVEVFNDFKMATEGQQNMVLDMLNKLSSWIQFLVDHVTSIYTLGFYLVISGMLFIVTSTPRTCRARAWLIFLWLSIFLSEFKIKLDPHVLWSARYFGMAASFALLVYFGSVYQDYETLNNRLLNDLYRMVVTQFQHRPVSLQDQQALMPKPYTFVPSFNFGHQMHRSLNASSIREIHDDDLGSDTSSDATFIGNDEESESDASSASFYSFSTGSSAASSRPPTPVLDSSSGALTLISPPEEPTRYNLRPRRSLGNSTLNNSILERESPRSFTQLVKWNECNSKFHSMVQTKMGGYYETTRPS